MKYNPAKLGLSKLVISKIASHNNFVIVFVASLLSILLAVKSTHSVQSCQKMKPSITIIDESGGKRLAGNTLATLEDSPFKNYVTNVSQHISTKIEETSQCSRSSKSSPEVELFFVYRPLTTPATAPFDFKYQKSNTIRLLDSPWVKIEKSSSQNHWGRAVFVWNERQFLFDQALMAGSQVSPTNLLPIDESVFGQYVRDYTDSILGVPQKDRSVAQANISKRVPTEILWLFRHAWQSTRGPFSGAVYSAQRATIKRAATGYTALGKTIFAQFLVSEKPEMRYKSVLDLKDVFSFDSYRVERLR
jgi:hypothetical protein